MTKSSSSGVRLLTSAGLGLIAAGTSWLVFYISALVLGTFVPEVSKAGGYAPDIAAAVRTSLYLMWIFVSIQVWFFSTLYFFDRNRDSK